MASSSSSPSSSCLISFCGRVSIIGSRSRPFQPRKDAFLRLRGDVITIHRDEEHSQLLMPPLSVDNLILAKRKGTIFKMYFSHHSSEAVEREERVETVVRVGVEEKIASAFSFLLHESWRDRRRSEWSNCEDEEWIALARGWTRRRCIEKSERMDDEKWRETWITVTSGHILLLFDDCRKEEKIDMRKVTSCSSHFDRVNWCDRVLKEKEKEERQSVYSISLNMTYPQVRWIDSGEMKIVSTLRSLLSLSSSTTQRSLLTCRLSEGDVPIVIEEAIRFLSTEKRLSTRGIYRISAKNVMKNKLVEQMIHSPCTVFSSLDGLRSDTNVIAMNGEYAKDEVYMVCDGLRSFLRRMESPLIPEVLHIPLFDAMAECSPSCRQEKVQSVMLSRRFPSVHRKTLSLLLSHLVEVAKRSEYNGMTSDNLSRILAPCLFSSESSWEVVDDITPRVNSTLFLIDNYHLLSI